MGDRGRNGHPFTSVSRNSTKSELMSISLMTTERIGTVSVLRIPLLRF
jgi:hypothetical protein